MKKIILLFAFLLTLNAFSQENNSSKEQIYKADMEKLTILTAPVQAKANVLNQEIGKQGDRIKTDEAYQSEMIEKFSELNAEISVILIQFIKDNPNSPVSLEVLSSLSSSEIPFPEIESLYESLSNELKSSAEGMDLKKRLTSIKATAIGSIAPEFVQLDPDDKPISLTDFRGKYVLIDFWASWCGPCRRENPHLVKAYEQFKGERFEILGVSLDNPGQKQTWLKAIEKDNLTWTQVSDLKGWQNAAALQYGVKSIPQNFLIDPNGVIIAKKPKRARTNQKTGKNIE
ncbi:TlpA family protein disulfide reductase [Bacteroidales bacterium OttesenSCG-928-M11]|nr:TlpA family protein disulfide reductase [Bacteroidales bacterium OttesenSCG-928-M11]